MPGEETSDDARKAEAKAIALRILDIVDNFEVYDGKTDSLRKAKFSDIALLFRSPTKWNTTFPSTRKVSAISMTPRK